ncbi:hypothetical protein RSAG8_13625, partial [Rhizoctonia solani AG-8 WAC10335]
MAIEFDFPEYSHNEVKDIPLSEE